MRFNLLETFMNHGLETSNRPSHPNRLWIKRNLEWYQDSEIGQPPPGCNVPVNPFVPNVPFLHPLQTSENRKIFWCFQGVEKGCIGYKWVKGFIEHTNQKSVCSMKVKAQKQKAMFAHFCINCELIPVLSSFHYLCSLHTPLFRHCKAWVYIK